MFLVTSKPQQYLGVRAEPRPVSPIPLGQGTLIPPRRIQQAASLFPPPAAEELLSSGCWARARKQSTGSYQQMDTAQHSQEAEGHLCAPTRGLTDRSASSKRKEDRTGILDLAHPFHLLSVSHTKGSSPQQLAPNQLGFANAGCTAMGKKKRSLR